MVDFKKRLAGRNLQKLINPVELYDTLDRAHDKGPLRPAQKAVLEEWFYNRRSTKDVVLKLHTGQGKTLVGLLILQSYLNEGKGPALYLCPDHFLTEQTCEQARQFGISTCIAEPDLPDAFTNGKTILVTSVQKLFNGLTRFGLNKQSVSVGCVLMDDAHACSDIIRTSCRIRIPKDEPAYANLRTLFAKDLEEQGIGTHADICNEKYDALLPVPYWAWMSREAEVAKLLSSASDRQSVKFAWPVLKDRLRSCQCVISGAAIEIEPAVPPLSAFGSYWNSPHRVFMSATVTDDSFLVKGLRLTPEVIAEPLRYENERWSGEKMILLPSLMDDALDRDWVVNTFASSKEERKRTGVVALATSFAWTKDWEKGGALVAKNETVSEIVAGLKKGEFDRTVVLVNRYDGIDLPDDSCRILIFDRKPYSESLIDLYYEGCRANSLTTLMRTIRTIEQGMGRSVRGEKDYSVIIITGPDLTRLVREKSSRQFLSPQMATQIEIGLEIVDAARTEIDEGTSPEAAFHALIRQSLNRDEGWKSFYVENMEKVHQGGANSQLLRVYAMELQAEEAYLSGDYAAAIKSTQNLLDTGAVGQEDRAWYLQEMARYAFSADRPESNRLQLAAHKSNRFLLKPAEGVTVSKLTLVSQGRMEAIASWIGRFDNYAQLNVTLSDILNRLVFGTKADRFESALDELSRAMGFAGERPDKEWKEGPDNLWALNSTQYLLWECKSEVDILRAEINKREAEQMNRSSAWFEKHYPGLQVKRVIVHPSNSVESAAAFTHEVEAMREPELRSLVKHITSFFKTFESRDLKDLSTKHIQDLVESHDLSVEKLLSAYSRKLKNQT